MRRYERLRGYNGPNPNRRWETGRAYVRVGDIQEMLGNRSEAEKAYRTGQEYLDALVQQFPENPVYQRDLATCLNNFGNLLQRFNDVRAAEAPLKRAAALREKIEAWHNKTY